MDATHYDPVRRIEPSMADLLDRITIEPDTCGSRPCIGGMRIRVIDVIAALRYAGIDA